MKNSWPSPLYTVHSSYGAGDNRLFIYKVHSMCYTYLSGSMVRAEEALTYCSCCHCWQIEVGQGGG